MLNNDNAHAQKDLNGNGQPQSDNNGQTNRPRTCVRTTILKLRPPYYSQYGPGGEDRLFRDLDYTARAIGQKTTALRNFLIACRGEEYFDGKETITKNQVITRQLAYCRSCNPALAAPLFRQFYDFVMSTDHNVVISYVSPMYKADSKIAQATRISRKTGERNPVDPGKALCRQLLDLGVFPIVKDDLPLGNYYKAAWVQAFTTLRAWHEADVRYRGETEKLLDRLDEIKEKKIPEAMEGAYWQFLLAMDNAGRKADRFFARRWVAIRRGLLSGHSLRQGEAEFFEPFRELWEDEDRLSDLLEMEGLRHQIEDRQVSAAMPTFDDTTTILCSISGTNTVPLELHTEDAEHDVPAMAGTITLIDHIKPAEVREATFGCLPSQYCVGLVAATEKRGGTQIATARYAKGNLDRIPVTATIKEPRFRRIGKSWYIDLIQNVEIVPATQAGGDLKSLYEQIGYFVSTKTKLSAGDVKPGLRVLSVDLGLNPVLAYSVYELGCRRQDDDSIEVAGVGWANLAATGILGGTKSEKHREAIMDLRKSISPLKDVIRFRGRLLRRDGNAEGLDPRYLDSVLAAFRSVGIEYDSDPVTLKRTLLDEIRNVRRAYHRLVKFDPFRPKDSKYKVIGMRWRDISREQFEWVQAVGEWIQLLKTWRFNGPKRQAADGTERLKHTVPGDFGIYYRYMGSVKRDAIRKIAAEVRKLALRHQCDIVLVEDLEYFRQSVIQEKGVNSLLSLWSPNTILGWIENALEPHAIPVVRVDPRNTSRIDPRTGEFGFNDFRAAKEVLLVEQDGQFQMVNADIAAACNLQRRFWLRNSDVYQLQCMLPPGKTPVPIVADTPTGIRIRRYFDATVMSHYAHIDGEAQLLPLPGRLYKEAEAESSGKTERFYRHNGRWLSWEDHVKAADALFDRFVTAQSQASESEEGRRFIERVKATRAKRLRQKT